MRQAAKSTLRRRAASFNTRGARVPYAPRVSAVLTPEEHTLPRNTKILSEFYLNQCVFIINKYYRTIRYFVYLDIFFCKNINIIVLNIFNSSKW